MLCELCANIDLDDLLGSSGYRHHFSGVDLCMSAKNGCVFCGTILAAYDNDPNTQIEKHKLSHIQLEKLGPFIIDSKWGIDAAEDLTGLTVVGCGTKFGQILLFTTRDDPLAEMVSGRLVSPHLNDYVSIVKDWIRNCETHPVCTEGIGAVNRLPTRVIDVGPIDGTVHPFLHEPGGKMGKWVTLSHRWGNADTISLTHATFEQRQSQIPMNSLPPLFRDAVTITRSLGYRYLWIDSLCIVQDSESDWRSEAARMGYIYKYSSLTIAAESSRDCHEGVFASSDRRWPTLEDSFSLPCHSSSRQIRGNIYPKLDSEAPARRDFLGSRAWTLQEDILSPRAIIWTSRGLKWQCRSAEYDKGIQLGSSLQECNYYNWKHNNWKRICLRRQDLLKQDSFSSGIEDSNSIAMEIWYSILQNFVRRNITNHADRLPAISGVAREIARLTGYRYVVGLWSKDIWPGLLWSTNGKAKRLEDAQEPSWSWASIELDFDDQILHFTPRNFPLSTIWASVLGINIPSVGNDPFGQVNNARLHLKGPCQYGSQLCAWLRDNGYPDNDGPIPRFIKFSLDCSSDSLAFEKHDVMFLQIASGVNDTVPSMAASIKPRGPQSMQGPGAINLVTTQPSLHETHSEANMVRYALVLKPTGLANLEFKRIGISTIPYFMARTTTNTWKPESIAVV